MPFVTKILFATREQELLLQAALLEGDKAISAWQKYKKKVALEGHHENGSYRLFPLLYRNLQRNNIEDPFMHRLKGIYRQAWYKNQRLFYDISKILSSLHDERVRTMILKGAALTILHYKNYAVRPMADVDVMVHTSEALLAVDVLKRLGWKPTTDLTEADLLYRHSGQFIDNSGKEVDLHWHLLYDSCWDGCDDDFWDGAVPLTLGGVPTLAANPADMLLNVIVHGVKWNPEPAIRWIADAITLINSSDPGIDWGRLISQAKKHRVVLHLKKALNYLKDIYRPHIPSAYMKTINSIHTSPMEFLEYQYVTRNLYPGSHTTPIHQMINFCLSYFFRYRRLCLNKGSVKGFSITDLFNYILYREKKKNAHDLIISLASRGMRNTKRSLLSALKVHDAN